MSRVEGDPVAGDLVDVVDSSGKFIAWGKRGLPSREPDTRPSVVSSTASHRGRELRTWNGSRRPRWFTLVAVYSRSRRLEGQLPANVVGPSCGDAIRSSRSRSSNDCRLNILLLLLSSVRYTPLGSKANPNPLLLSHVLFTHAAAE